VSTVLTALRVLFYLQAVLGLGRFAGFVTHERLWETHVSLGILIALLALVVLRPLAGLPRDPVRVLARFAPLLPLATGLAIYAGRVANLGFTWVHMVLGLMALGLVEAAAGRERRARARAGRQA
jgi:hypothetical protein